MDSRHSDLGGGSRRSSCCDSIRPTRSRSKPPATRAQPARRERLGRPCRLLGGSSCARSRRARSLPPLVKQWGASGGRLRYRVPPPRSGSSMVTLDNRGIHVLIVMVSSIRYSQLPGLPRRALDSRSYRLGSWIANTDQIGIANHTRYLLVAKYPESLGGTEC